MVATDYRTLYPKIVLVGQTRSDGAAPDRALSRGIECGGWWPKGRKAEMVFKNTCRVSLNPKELEDLLDEVEASRRSRQRGWENLAEIRWVLKDTAGVELPSPASKTIDLEGRIVKDGVRKTIKDRQTALGGLVKAIRVFRKFTDVPLTLRGADYAHAVLKVNNTIDRADGLLQ